MHHALPFDVEYLDHLTPIYKKYAHLSNGIQLAVTEFLEKYVWEEESERRKPAAIIDFSSHRDRRLRSAVPSKMKL